ncbi:MAG: hypothetical protein ACRD25_13195, partial [Terracidiphilus sp.]
MQLFRMRLILALILSVTVVSLAFTYFDVLAHRHMLRGELERRTQWMGVSLTPDIQGALGTGDPSSLAGLTQLLKSGTGALALAVYGTDGRMLASAGPPSVLHSLPPQVIEDAIRQGTEIGRFGHAGN